jgi:UMF1 family MFS transporter
MVSSYGYGFGYIGGSTIPFVAAIVLVMFGENFGVSKDLAARISFVIAACWWLVFSIPFLRDVRQKYSVPRERGMIAKSLRNIIETFVNIKKYKAVFVFLLAYFFYIDGVNTVIHMATIYGASVGIDETQMIIALLVIQILAFPFALLFGRLSKKFGGAAMLKTGIVVYIGICVFAYFMTQSWQFWLIAVLVSTCQGGMQAISRSYFAGMLPKEKSNEFFGFYDIFGKFAAIMGPALYGFFTQIFGETRYGVLSIALLFVAGGAVFLFSERKKQDS